MTSTTTYGAIIEAEGLSMTAEWADRNPHIAADDRWNREATHYLVTISNAVGGTMGLHYSMGSAHTDAPTLDTVLDSLASDASSVENAPDWLDWAEEMGYEDAADLRRARATHAVIVKQAAELKALLGDDAYDALLWNTERL
jgi:hypothetical protein